MASELVLAPRRGRGILPTAEAKAKARAKVGKRVAEDLKGSWHRALLRKAKRLTALAADAVGDPLAALQLKQEAQEIQDLLAGTDAVTEAFAFLEARAAKKTAESQERTKAKKAEDRKEKARARAKKSREKLAEFCAARGAEIKDFRAAERAGQRARKKAREQHKGTQTEA